MRDSWTVQLSSALLLFFLEISRQNSVAFCCYPCWDSRSLQLVRALYFREQWQEADDQWIHAACLLLPMGTGPHVWAICLGPTKCGDGSQTWITLNRGFGFSFGRPVHDACRETVFSQYPKQETVCTNDKNVMQLA